MEFGPPGHEGGGADKFETTQFDFYRYNSTCNLPQAPTECKLTNFTNAPQNFNPLSLILSWGSLINLKITDNTNGFVLYMIGVDLMASGPPSAQYDATANDSSEGGTFNKARRIGSMAPQVYDKAYVGSSYSDAELNDGVNVSVLLSKTFDDNWIETWNSTNDSNGTGVPVGYADYNQIFFNASTDYGTAHGGILCNSTAQTEPCFINTTENMIWIEIPHFSGSDAGIKGSTVPTTSVSYSSSGGSTVKTLETSVEISCNDQSITLEIDKTDSEVRVVSTDYLQSYEIELTDGKFIKTGLVNGEYYVLATRSGYRQYKEMVIVNCEETNVEVLSEPISNETKETSVVDELTVMEDAKMVIDNADSAIKKAESEKRTEGLEAAREKIKEAALAFDANNYEYAKTLAEESTSLANNALAPAIKKIVAQETKTTVVTKTAEQTPVQPSKGICPLGVVLLAIGTLLIFNRKER
jgi:hypothetical protein